MSMTRDDALAQLASGLRKFDGYTVGQFLDAGWDGLHGLAPADLAFFEARRALPLQDVARSCMGRSRYSAPDGAPALPATDAVVHMRVPAHLKAAWVKQSQASGMKLADWIVQRVEVQR